MLLRGSVAVLGRIMYKPLDERYWCKVEKTDGCWIWRGAKTCGYGVFGIRNNQLIYAHRYSYYTMVGDIPLGLEIDHLCRNTLCVNPEHMEAVAHKENCIRVFARKKNKH